MIQCIERTEGTVKKMTALAGYVRAAGIRVGELATDVGVSRRHLTGVLAGYSRPSTDLLARIAQRLEMPVETVKENLR